MQCRHSGTAFITSAACRVLQKTCLVRQRHFGACPPSSLPPVALDLGAPRGPLQAPPVQALANRDRAAVLGSPETSAQRYVSQGRIVCSVFDIATGTQF